MTDPSEPALPPTERNPPGPIGRWFARAPRILYKARLGRLLGRRFLLLHHVGRTSGLPRETVLEVVRYDDASIEVAAAWGRKSDWFRNLQSTPGVRIDTGPVRGLRASASVVPAADAVAVFAAYGERHPRAARTLARTLGLPLEDPTAMAAVVPLIRLTLR